MNSMCILWNTNMEQNGFIATVTIDRSHALNAN